MQQESQDTIPDKEISAEESHNSNKIPQWYQLYQKLQRQCPYRYSPQPELQSGKQQIATSNRSTLNTEITNHKQILTTQKRTKRNRNQENYEAESLNRISKSKSTTQRKWGMKGRTKERIELNYKILNRTNLEIELEIGF